MDVSNQPPGNRMTVRQDHDKAVRNLPVRDAVVFWQVFGLCRPGTGQYRQNSAFGGGHGKAGATSRQQRALTAHQLSRRTASGTCGQQTE